MGLRESCDADTLRDYKRTMKTWIEDDVLPLAEVITDRVETDAGVHAHIPTVVKGLREEAVTAEITRGLLSAFEEHAGLVFKDSVKSIVVIRRQVRDLSLMGSLMRFIDKMTDAEEFHPTVCVELGLDEFVENKYKALERFATSALLNHMCDNMEEAEAQSSDSDDSDDAHDADDSDGEKKCGSDESEEEEGDDSDEDQSSDSGSGDEEKLVANAASDSDDEHARPSKTARTE